MLPWWGWVLIAIGIIIFIIILCYIFRERIPVCGVICDGFEDIDFDIGDGD